MTSFHHRIRSIENLHVICRLGGTKYLVYSHFVNKEFSVRATDGISVWNHSYSEEGLEAECKNMGLEIDTYISKIRHEFSELSLSKSDDCLQLYSTSKLDFKLTKMDDLSMREEIQRILFHYAEKTMHFEKSSPAPSPTKVEKPDDKNVVNKKAGMSMINPASRKRKKAQGVVYD